MVMGAIRQLSDDPVKKMKHARLVPEGAHMDKVTVEAYSQMIADVMNKHEDDIRRRVFQN